MSSVQGKVGWLALAITIVAAGAFLGNAAREDSPVMDELAHLPAGYAYVRLLDYRLNPEHPPLLKALAALPLLFLKNIAFPTDDPGWTKGVNDQWNLGSRFLYESGNDGHAIIILARIFPILLTLITIFVLYLWARELLGPVWGLIPTIFFAFSPTVLAHGHYVTTDIAATFGILASTFTFVRFLQKRTTGTFVLAGIAFGIAQLMKFSAVLLIPFFFFLALIAAVTRAARTKRGGVRESAITLLNTTGVMTLGCGVVYAAYLLFTWNYPLEKNVSDAQNILASAPHWVSFAVTWLIAHPLLRPLGQYLLGVAMALARSLGGNTNYFLGTVTNAGWWYYFPVVFLLKETLPALGVVFLGIILGTWRFLTTLLSNRKRMFRLFADYLGVNLPEFAMLSFVVFYWAYSMKSPLNIGVRHLLPTIPLLYILATSAIKNWIQGSKESGATIPAAKIVKTSIIALLLVWHIGETSAVSPSFLSSFNELGGGAENGHTYVVDSNYDWGQDLSRLKTFVEERGIRKIAVDYFGGGNSAYELGAQAEPWHSSLGNPKERGIEWLAVSINFLHGSFGKTTAGFERKSEDEYQWLGEARNTPRDSSAVPAPDFRAGTSLFVYHL